MARGLGESIREFKAASSGQLEKTEKENNIIETAKKMGIKTEGKKIEEILKEINSAVDKK